MRPDTASSRARTSPSMSRLSATSTTGSRPRSREPPIFVLGPAAALRHPAERARERHGGPLDGRHVRRQLAAGGVLAACASSTPISSSTCRASRPARTRLRQGHRRQQPAAPGGDPLVRRPAARPRASTPACATWTSCRTRARPRTPPWTSNLGWRPRSNLRASIAVQNLTDDGHVGASEAASEIERTAYAEDRVDVRKRSSRELGCDAIQGYLLMRPAPADEMGAWLATRAAREA